MSSLLSDDEKKQIQLELDNVRDTFFRDIYVYIKKYTDSPNDLPQDYNPLYSAPKQTTRHTTTRNTMEKVKIHTFKNLYHEKENVLLCLVFYFICK